MGEGCVEGVRRWVWFRPRNLVYDLESHRLQGETEAEDDVVGAGNPDGALGLEDAARLLKPPDVEPVILSEPHRAYILTTLTLALQGTLGRRRASCADIRGACRC